MKKLLKSPLFYFNLFLVAIIGILITMPSVAQKVTAAVGNILGTGTASYLAAFTGANQIGNSQIYDSGSNIGIGTTNPSAKLHVSGNVRADTGFCIGANCITAWPAGGGGGTLTGSGTANKLAKWTGTNSLGDSAVSEISNTLIKVGSLSLGSNNAGTGVLTDSGSFGVGNLSATTYANVLANDYYIGALGKWASQLVDFGTTPVGKSFGGGFVMSETQPRGTWLQGNKSGTCVYGNPLAGSSCNCPSGFNYSIGSVGPEGFSNTSTYTVGYYCYK